MVAGWGLSEYTAPHDFADPAPPHDDHEQWAAMRERGRAIERASADDADAPAPAGVAALAPEFDVPVPPAARRTVAPIGAASPRVPPRDSPWGAPLSSPVWQQQQQQGSHAPYSTPLHERDAAADHALELDLAAFDLAALDLGPPVFSYSAGPQSNVPQSAPVQNSAPREAAHPTRSVLVRNVPPGVDDDDIRSLLETFGPLRELGAQHRARGGRGSVMATYFDLRHARNAVRSLDMSVHFGRRLDARFQCPSAAAAVSTASGNGVGSGNASDVDHLGGAASSPHESPSSTSLPAPCVNQGTLVVFNLDASTTAEQIRTLFGAVGDVKEIRATPNKRHHKFVEFYDIRDAERALLLLNKTEVGGKKIKIEISRPGGRGLGSSRGSAGHQQHHQSQVHPTPSPPPPSMHPQQHQQTMPHPNMYHHSQPTSQSLPFHSPYMQQQQFMQQQQQQLRQRQVYNDSQEKSASSVNMQTPNSSLLDGMAGGFDTMPGTRSLFTSAHVEVGPPRHTPGESPHPPLQSHFPPLEFARSESHPDPFPGDTNVSSTFAQQQRQAHIPQSPFNPLPNQSPSQPSRQQFPQSLSELLSPPQSQQLQGDWANAFSLPSLSSGGVALGGRAAAPNGGASSTGGSYGAIGSGRGATGSNCSPDRSPLLSHSTPPFSPVTHSTNVLTGLFSDELFLTGPGCSSGISNRANDTVQGSPSNLTTGASSVRGIGNTVRSGHIVAGAGEDIERNSHRVTGSLSPAKSATGLAPQGAVSSSFKGQTNPKFALNIDKIRSGGDTRTAVMIRNIPNKYNQKMLLAALEESHRGQFDFIYLPIDFKNKCNVGYAFCNFTDPRHVVSFYNAFHGRKWGRFNSEKVCEITYARIQGRQQLISHFQNSSLLLEDPKCRPVVFDDEGRQLEFPMGQNVRQKRGPRENQIAAGNNTGSRSFDHSPPFSPIKQRNGRCN